MSVQLEICNDALNFLGAEPINDINESNKTARTCKRQYEIAKNYMLRTYTWNFALRREVITKTGNQLSWGETNEFLLPADCVRINKVLNDNYKPMKFKTEGRSIFALEDHINLSYVSNDVLEATYDHAFRRAVAAQMAGDMCYSITQSTSLMQGMYALAENFAGDSRSLDSMENTPEDFKFDYFDNARVISHEIYPNDDIF